MLKANMSVTLASVLHTTLLSLTTPGSCQTPEVDVTQDTLTSDANNKFGAHGLLLLLSNLATNLLVMACRTEKKSLYLHLLIYYKGYNSGTAKWKRYTGQERGN